MWLPPFHIPVTAGKSAIRSGLEDDERIIKKQESMGVDNLAFKLF